MKGNKELQEKLQAALSTYQFKSAPGNLYEPIRYILSLGAKRMRPQLLLMGCDLFGGDINMALKPALGIEFFHNFTLMHDDIMDNAPLRRANETVHQKWNTNIAILSGDAMYTQSFRLMMEVDQSILKDVLDIFCRTALEVCEGQQLDMDFETTEHVTIDDYLQMIGLKTAVLLAASLEIGARIAGANDADARHLYDFGKNMGIAFQLQDDYLDVYGDSDKFGKQVGGDIISNKKTFLLLKAIELAEEQVRKDLKTILFKERNPVIKVNKVKDIYNRMGVQELSARKIEDFYLEGMKHLQAISVPAEQKKNLLEFAGMLLQREH